MFDIHQTIFDPDSGETDEERKACFMDGLMRAFASSPEAAPIVEQFGRLGWVNCMMDYAFNYLGVDVAKMSLPDFNEVVFELFPRKVSTEPESADAIVAELRAFWTFIHRQYGLDNAQVIRDSLTEEEAEKLRDALSDPSNFGMAKSLFMQGKEAGFDMTTKEGLAAFQVAYNNAILQKRLGQAVPPPVRPKLKNVEILTNTNVQRTVSKASARKVKRKQERQSRKPGFRSN